MKNKMYFDNLPDGEVDFGKNKIRYWRAAGVVQFIKLYEKDGNKGIASTVAVNLDALRESDEAMALIKKIFEDIA